MVDTNAGTRECGLAMNGASADMFRGFARNNVGRYVIANVSST